MNEQLKPAYQITLKNFKTGRVKRLIILNYRLTDNACICLLPGGSIKTYQTNEWCLVYLHMIYIRGDYIK